MKDNGTKENPKVGAHGKKATPAIADNGKTDCDTDADNSHGKKMARPIQECGKKAYAKDGEH